jgi:hypothetical protein
MKKLNKSWEYNVLGVYDWHVPGKLDIYYQWIIDNHSKIDGDILEAGVFRGKSLLATALLLKELGSNKKVYGFDSFSGFPPVYHQNDDLAKFEVLYQKALISDRHIADHRLLIEYRKMIKGVEMTVANISSSSDFSDTSDVIIQKKAEFLSLDNIVLVKGDFAETMSSAAMPELRLIAALLDCDLYDSYKVALPYIWERLVSGGYIHLDEYYSLKFPGARIACDEFFKAYSDKPLKAPSVDREFERWYVQKSN